MSKNGGGGGRVSIGSVNIKTDKRNNKCFWGFYLGEVDVPRGSGAVMEFFALEHIFEGLNMRKVCCEVFSFNRTVIKLHKKFGFVEEGCFVKHISKSGKYEDVVPMAMFAEDWIKVKPKLERLLFGNEEAQRDPTIKVERGAKQ